METSPTTHAHHLNLCKTLFCALFCFTLIFNLTSCMNLNAPKKTAETGSFSFTINNEIIDSLKSNGRAFRTAGYDRSISSPVISIVFTLYRTSGGKLISPVTITGSLSELTGKTIVIDDIPLNTSFTVSVSFKVNGEEFMKGTSKQINLVTTNTAAVEISLEYTDSPSNEIISYYSLCGTWAFDYGYNQDIWADEQITFYEDGTFDAFYKSRNYSVWYKGTWMIQQNEQGQPVLVHTCQRFKNDERSNWEPDNNVIYSVLNINGDELILNRYKEDRTGKDEGIRYCDPAEFYHAYRATNGTREQLLEDKWTAVKSNDYWDSRSFTWTFSEDGTMQDSWTDDGDTQDFPGTYRVYQEGGKKILYQNIDFGGGANQEVWYSITSLGPNLICLETERIINNGEEGDTGNVIYAFRDVPLVKYTYHWKVNDELEYTFNDYWPEGETYTLLDLSKRSLINGLQDTYLDQALLGWHLNENLEGGRINSITASKNTIDRDFYAEWGFKGHHNGDDEDYCWTTTGVPANDLFDSISFNADDMIAILFEADLSNDINGWTGVKFWPEEWGTPIGYALKEVHTTGRHLSEKYLVKTTQVSGNNMIFEYVYNQETGPVVFSNCNIEILDTVTLNILTYGDEDHQFMRICDEFQAENPEIIINYEMFGDEEYHRKVDERIASNNIPDIAYMGADARWGDQWKNANQQIDNTPYMPANIDQSLIPDFYGTGVKPYIPLGQSNFCSVVGVNMKLLNEIGGTLPKTYEEFKELAQLCAANNIICLSTHGADDWVWGSCVLSGIIPRTTGKLTWIDDALKGDVNFTDDDFVAALNVLSQWITDGILTPEAAQTDDGTGKSNFAEGKYLMYIDGQWGFGESTFGDFSKDIKLITIPPVPGETDCPGSMAGAWQPGYGITKKGASDSKVLEAAKKWMAYYYSYEETVQRLQDGAISAPIIKNFVTTEGMDPLTAEKATLGTYPSCYVIDTYLTGNANDTLNAGMKAIVQGIKTAEEVAAEVQSAFDAQ